MSAGGFRSKMEQLYCPAVGSKPDGLVTSVPRRRHLTWQPGLVKSFIHIFIQICFPRWVQSLPECLMVQSDCHSKCSRM